MIVGDLSGSAISHEQIERARLAILDQYRRDDYVYTAVSATLGGETRQLTFVVTEGFVAEVRLSRDVGPAGTRVLRFLNHLLEPEAKPLKTKDLERWVLLASDVPGLNARATLLPSADEPGALTLVADVSHKEISVLLSADNRAYQYSGPTQGLASVDLNSFTSLGERTTLTIFHSIDQTQLFGQGATEFFVGDEGLKVRLYGGAGDSRPGGALAATGYNGFTTIFGGQVSYPVIRERQMTLNLFGMFDALDGAIVNNGVHTYDSLRVLRVGPDFVWSDIWLSGPLGRWFGDGLGQSWSAANSVSTRVSKGLTLLGASRNGAADAGRAGEVVDFTKGTLNVARTQALYSWQGKTLSLRGEVAGQYTQDVLPAAEEFLLGGSHFNRGFYAGEVTGDSGMTATAELSLETPLKLGILPAVEPKAEFYGFFDFGQTWESRPQDAAHTLRSAGVGVRLFPTGSTKYELDLEAVKRLQLFPQGSRVDALKGEALYWQLAVRF